MFAFIESFRARAAIQAADMIDLAIEFTTLGEYGLEYPESAVPESRSAIRDCPADSRRMNPARDRPSPRRNPEHHQSPRRDRRPRSEGRRANI